MADSEQGLQDKLEITQACRAFGVDTPIALAQPGDEGGERHLSEYSLHIKMALVPMEGWAGAGYRRWVW